VDDAAPIWANTYGFRVLAPALPGFAGSPPAALDDYRPSRLARIVSVDLGTRGIERFSLVGFSWGATIGCHVDPRSLTALVLLDIGYKTFDDVPTLEERLAEFADADFADPVIVGTAFHGVDIEPAETALPAVVEGGVPTLLLAATEPHVERRAADLARFRERFPAIDVREIGGAEHNILATQPETTIPLVGEWLRTVTIRRA
jgi:pimeloyl-ACP methyl ester carboxylesterase